MNKMTKLKIPFFAFIGLFVSASLSQASNSLYQFQQGVYNGLSSGGSYTVSDTYLSALLPTTNYGGTIDLLERADGNGAFAGLLNFNMSAAATAAGANGVLTSTLTLTAADTSTAVNFSQPLMYDTVGTLRTLATCNIGIQFVIGANPIVVNSLGVSVQSSTTPLGESHQVGIWNSSGTLVASATVPSGTAGTLVGDYRYATLSPPVTLTAGATYRLGAYYATTADPFRAQTPTTFDTSLVNSIQAQYETTAHAFSNPTIWAGGTNDSYASPNMQVTIPISQTPVMSDSGAAPQLEATCTVGIKFVVGANPIVVNSLGVLVQSSTTPLGESHQVGIWNSSGTLVASATVPSGTAGTLVGDYRYANLSTPVTLTAGATYQLGAYYATTADSFRYHAVTGYNTSLLSSIQAQYNTTAGALANPTTWAGSHGDSYASPNMQVVAAPATYTIYAMPSSNTSWTNTSATYNYLNQSTSTSWKLTSGSNASNGVAAALSGRVLGSWTGPLPTAGQQIPISLDPTIIAQMLATPSQNTGFLIYYSVNGGLSSGGFCSSECTTSGSRPLLTIEIPASRTSVDISQPPYSANTGMADVGGIINQAISDMLAQGGGTVYIPAGNWTFTTQIKIGPSTQGGGSIILRGDGAHIAGQAGGTDLIFTHANGDGTDAIVVDGSSNPAEFMRVFIRELAIDGGNQAAVTGSTLPNNHNGLVLNQANTYQLNHVTVSGFNAAGIVINNSSYGSISDGDIGYCGTGVDCTSAVSDQFLNTTVHYCKTRALHNPQAMVGCWIENNNMDGIVLDATGLALSLHDCYFANNNATNSGEHADISAAGGNPTLSISGHSEFNGTTPEPSVPYRRLMGTFNVVTRSGAAHFITTSTNASLDVTSTTFLDNSTERTPTNLSWKTGTTGSDIYEWNYQNQTTFTTKP